MREMGLSGILYALYRGDVKKEEQLLGFPVFRISVKKPAGGKWKFLEFNWKLFRKLLFTRARVFHVHDLWPMPAVIAAAVLKSVPVIYDAHEYYMGLEIFRHKKIEKKIWRIVELLSIPVIKSIITVSDPLLELYKKTYPSLKKKVGIVLRNVPDRDVAPDADEISFPFPSENKNIVLFQGIFKPGRGLIPLIRAFRYIDNAVLLMVGYGELENELKKEVQKLQLQDKIYFTGKVPVEWMIPIAKKSMIGIVLFEPTSLNYKFALPNKFFEYIHAGIPVIASDIPTFKGIYSRYKFGIIVDPSDETQIRDAIRTLLTEPDFYKKCREEVQNMKDVFIWNKEKKHLESVYKKFI
jgi:glycosyltransferase involved in cell wall biosynthesis